ncbi:hypothetical protein ACS0TY_019391 [Phlomoides rotata]
MPLGTEPVKLLYPKLNTCKKDKLERSEGMVPVKWLKLRSSDRRNVRFPMCGAMVPPRSKWEMFRAVTYGV